MSGYKYLTYEEIVDGLLALAKTHPKICKVYTAQERYGLPHAGECGEEKCKQWVVAVGNIERHTRFTPEVFFFWCVARQRAYWPQRRVPFGAVFGRILRKGPVCYEDGGYSADRCHAYAECLGLPPEPEGRAWYGPQPRLRVRHVPYVLHANDSGEVCERSLAGAPISAGGHVSRGRQPHWVPVGGTSHTAAAATSRRLAIERNAIRVT